MAAPCSASEAVAVHVIVEVTPIAGADDRALAAYDRYRAAVPALIARFGGRYLARAAEAETLEGVTRVSRWHLLEFPDADAARSFWSSPDYVALTPLRAGAATVRAVLVGGNHDDCRTR
jgi:uncharacterized protein (DUF1330 family)